MAFSFTFRFQFLFLNRVPPEIPLRLSGCAPVLCCVLLASLFVGLVVGVLLLSICYSLGVMACYLGSWWVFALFGWLRGLLPFFWACFDLFLYWGNCFKSFSLIFNSLRYCLENSLEYVWNCCLARVIFAVC